MLDTPNGQKLKRKIAVATKAKARKREIVFAHGVCHRRILTSKFLFYYIIRRLNLQYVLQINSAY